jgi:hypothetical protein
MSVLSSRQTREGVVHSGKNSATPLGPGAGRGAGLLEIALAPRTSCEHNYIVLNYDLHKLGWHSFQQLCLTIAREVLGQTVQSFLDSKDGGRDGAFAGTWKPQEREILKGKFVIQCKFSSKPTKPLAAFDGVRTGRDGICTAPC